MSNRLMIKVDGLGKKFGRQWIFRNLTITFEVGQAYTFVGPNGSGKSTLLQVLAGAMPKTEGKIGYFVDNQNISEEHWYKYITIAAPYLELIEELSPTELIAFHVKFKPLKPQISTKSLLESLDLKHSENKPIKYFSSGMKQRLKLGLAFASDVPLVMLDEPTANLDAHWSGWYKQQVMQLLNKQTLIICSNMPYEYDFCENIVNLNDCKPI